ncbi:DUF6228 family protein [Kitasatospora sp. NPDC057940]|uniref:DUF6228 family protein n=1 Tax=Kitasatospora sp. NPDC057940 TaxID=3346285 RepID=UPI0036D803F1
MNDQDTDPADPTDPTDPTDSPAVDVRCRNDPATRVRLTDRHFPDEHGTGFAVELHAEGLRARLDSVTAWAWGPDHPADFLDELAADYRGWEAERTWRTHRLALRAVFRPGGHVGLTWTVRPRIGRDSPWEASVTTWLEAGEQLAGLASDVRRFLDPGDPTESRPSGGTA